MVGTLLVNPILCQQGHLACYTLALRMSSRKVVEVIGVLAADNLDNHHPAKTGWADLTWLSGGELHHLFSGLDSSVSASLLKGKPVKLETVIDAYPLL